MRPPRPSLPADFGKYVLLERIASGGMAEVYRAVMRGAAGFVKPVALKRILPFFCDDEAFVTLFQDEARIASTLTHANIAQVFDFGEVDGSYYLALELVDGTDLSTIVDRLGEVGQPMPLATATFIVAEAARGLAHAHEQRGPDGRPLGIVHRDVSPQNLLISRAGEVKVTDFGIAKAAVRAHKTATGVVMGKLRYMSPEQVDGLELDARSDLFSLGVILYELLTGGPVFPGEQTVRLAELIHSGSIPPPSSRRAEIPPALDEIVLRALARAPAGRPARAAELARDLTVFVQREAPGFTREDLAALVNRLVPEGARGAAGDAAGGAAASGRDDTVPMRGGAPPAAGAREPAAGPTAPGRHEGPASAAFAAAAASPTDLAPEPPTVLDPPVDLVLGPADRKAATPPGSTPAAAAAATAPAPRPAPAPRQLDVPTRTRVEPATGATGGSGARGASGASGARGASGTPSARGPGAIPARARRGLLSREAWIGLILGAIIVGSAALVFLRVVMPGPDRPAAGPPDAEPSLVEAPPDAGAHPAGERTPDAAWLAAPALLGEGRRRELQGQIERFGAVRRSTRADDYTAFLTALDWRVAVGEVLPDGRPAPSPPLPPLVAARVEANRVGPAVDAVAEYVAGTGELPPIVGVALRLFLERNPVVEGPLTDRTRPGVGWTAAALAAVGRAPDLGTLEALALANDALDRWCEPARPPRARRAPHLCELPAFLAALRAIEPDAPLAAALARRGEAHAAEAAVRAGDVEVRLVEASWRPARDGAPDAAVLVLLLEPRPRVGAAELTLALLGSLPDPVPAAVVELAAPDAGFEAGGATTPNEARLRATFTVPARIVAPVLAITRGADSVHVRVPPMPL